MSETEQFMLSFHFPARRKKPRLMEDTELGAHTVASHGVKVARFHLHDWIMLILLGALELVFYVVDPFDRFVGKDMMADLKYPLKSSTTVPFWAVPVCSCFDSIQTRQLL